MYNKPYRFTFVLKYLIYLIAIPSWERHYYLEFRVFLFLRLVAHQGEKAQFAMQLRWKKVNGKEDGILTRHSDYTSVTLSTHFLDFSELN